MTTLKAHFDGKVLVPDEPVNLPVNRALKVQVEPVEPSAIPSAEEKPLSKLLKAIETMPSNPDWPADGAARHDHYLYGSPKRPWPSLTPVFYWRSSSRLMRCAQVWLL